MIDRFPSATESPATERHVAGNEIAVLLGRRLRRLRESQGLSLRDLGERSGFSASFLSQVERGTSSAAISSLATIATALGTPLAPLFEVPEQTTLVVRHSERIPIHVDRSPVSYVRLAAAMGDRALEPVIVTFPPYFNDTREGLYRHKGEEFGLILQGRLTMTVDQQEYDLCPGDSIHFKSDVPHSSGTNRYAEPVVMLWVATPRLL